MNDSAPRFRDQAILEHLCHEHWAIQETVMDRLLEIVGRHADGVKLSAGEIAAAVGEKPNRKPEDEYQVIGDTAVIGITGVLAKHATMVNGISQPVGSSVQRIRSDLDRALADGRVKNILLRLESPGGMIAGINDLAEAIAAACEKKRVVAFADDMAASAAYWLAAQATEIYANAAAAVGSIGVVSILVDESAPESRDGRRFHVVRAGDRKGSAGAPVPISETDLAEAQGRVNALHQVFIAAVARGRGVAIDAIAPVADGRILTGQQAVEAGLVDAVATLDAVMAMLASGDSLPQPQPALTGRPGVPAAAHTSNVAAGDKESEMSEAKSSPQKPPAADAEAIRAAAVKEANEAAAQRVKDLTAVLGGRTELLTKCLAEGLDVPAAKALLADALAVENKTLGEQLAASVEKIQAVEGELASLKALVASSGIKPLAAGAKADSAAAEDPAKAYEQAVANRTAELIAKGEPAVKAKAQAYRETAKAHPDWHEAWKSQSARNG